MYKYQPETCSVILFTGALHRKFASQRSSGLTYEVVQAFLDALAQQIYSLAILAYDPL